MTSHKRKDAQKEREEEQWTLAAKKEGLTLSEFKRRACNERAYFVLNPGTRLAAGIFDTVGRLIKKEPVMQLEKICVCGHSVHYHSTTPGTNRHGSCGKAGCQCNLFSAQGFSGVGKKNEPKA